MKAIAQRTACNITNMTIKVINATAVLHIYNNWPSFNDDTSTEVYIQTIVIYVWITTQFFVV